MGATGLSAAANTLPRPFQHQVAQFSHDHLPFDLPEPPPPGQPFGAEMPHTQLVPGIGGETVPGPVPLVEKDHGTNGGHVGRSSPFPAASPSAGPTAASATSHPSYMPSPSSGSPSPDGDDYSEPDGKSPSPSQGSENNKPKRPPKNTHQGFGAGGDGKEHKPGKGKDEDQGDGQGNGPSPGAGPTGGDGGGQGGGLPALPPPLVVPDPPPPSPAPDPPPPSPAAELLPGADLPVDGAQTGGG